MLGLDTNVLVRFLVRDDDAQFAVARRLIRKQETNGECVFVSLLVLLETEWVLRSRYGVSKEAIIHEMIGLLQTADVDLEDEPTVEEAIFHWKDSIAEFADCLIGARNRRLGCRATATFDARAARLPDFLAL